MYGIYLCTKHHKGKEEGASLRFASWNVRTMCPGLSNKLTQIYDIRKTAVINNVLLRLNVDIAALQETNISVSGYFREQNYTFLWQGKPPKDA